MDAIDRNRFPYIDEGMTEEALNSLINEDTF